MVNEENSILVDYDPIQIADRMEYYFNHPDELATIRKKGMDFVKGTSWYKEAEKVYASMLKGIEEDEKKLQYGCEQRTQNRNSVCVRCIPVLLFMVLYAAIQFFGG